MKKTWKVLLLFCMVTVLLLGNSMSTFAAGGTISKAKAKQIALNKASVKSSSVKKWTKVKLDYWDDGNDKEWEIKFQTKKYKYEVEIDARTGRVEDFEKKKISSSHTKYIGLDKAKSIALTHAKKQISIKGSVWYSKAKFDMDDGLACYEIEFEYNNWEFEYEIDAKTGKILDWDMDYDD